MGMIRDQVRLYQNYSYEGSPGAAEEMGGVHIRAAQAEISFEHFETAIPILERVARRSAHYLASRYFLADCYAALEEWASAVDVLTEMVELKQSKLPYARWRLLTDEAKIKLAFIYYEWMEFDKAAELFNQLKSNSPFYDQVLMGKAWIAFQLDEYEEAITRTEELLNIYPRSTEIYEAGSLSGYCYEQLGQKSKAMTYFYEVLEAGVGRGKLQTFMKERRRIMDALAELEALGVKLLASGNEEAYQQFKRTRSQLILSLKRIGLAELLEANEGMKSLVAERILLDKLVQEQKGLEDQIESTEDASLMADFLALEDRIFDIMERLKIAGNQKLKETPLYYQEAQVGHINTLADTLSSRIESEIDQLVASIEATEVLYDEAFQSDETAKCLDYGLRLNQLQDILNRSYLHHVLAENSRRPVLRTRVDRWSDFSFSRYAMGGMEFDELERRYERLKQVEDYIATLDEMIEQAGALEKKEEPVSPQEESPSENLEDQTE
jgi:outer membrane protein assembly factor BamD (BamD/ComL family)